MSKTRKTTGVRPSKATADKAGARKMPAARRAKAAKSISGKAIPIFTIGYEKALPGAVIGELKRAKVELLVDVRAVAASRRPGFSKRQLAAELDEAGIAYLHLQPLGTPADGRTAARAGKTETLFRIYEEHLAGKPAQTALDDLLDLLRSGTSVALLCYCRNPHTCHRSRIIAEVQARLPVAVEHLIPPLF
ncbi:MAG TPA: DUF488 domain-containing protein [Pseudolabrys sp.]|nr:DUF488 domain-containing protein [Pseudolabrys sp.]